MVIHGINKLTLTDFPNRLSSILFTGNCNFRCPFCQNSTLVLNPESEPVIDENEIFSFLRKRKGFIDGVVITGGEPTVSKDLEDFIKRIKDTGLLVKLDSNGYMPDVLSSLIDKNLVDYIAMDIKNDKKHYAETAGVKNLDIARIERSVDLLKEGRIEYEFRTTVMKEKHTRATILSIGEWLEGSQNYFIQNYVDSRNILFGHFTPVEKEELLLWRNLLSSYIKNIQIR